MSAQQALALPLPAASNSVVINARCSLRIEADQRVIVVAGLPVHHYRGEDAVAEAYAMVFLVESGFAQQSSNANTVPPSRTTPNNVGRPCGASRSPMAGSASSCAQPALAWRSSSSNAATFPSASKSETSTSGPSSG